MGNILGLKIDLNVTDDNFITAKATIAHEWNAKVKLPGQWQKEIPPNINVKARLDDPAILNVLNQVINKTIEGALSKVIGTQVNLKLNPFQ